MLPRNRSKPLRSVSIPCPARYDAKRIWSSQARYDERLALFLLSDDHQLIGAFHQSKELSGDDAAARWAQHRWVPVDPGQPWPLTPSGRHLQLIQQGAAKLVAR